MDVSFSVDCRQLEVLRIQMQAEEERLNNVTIGYITGTVKAWENGICTAEIAMSQVKAAIVRSEMKRREIYAHYEPRFDNARERMLKHSARLHATDFAVSKGCPVSLVKVPKNSTQ